MTLTFTRLLTILSLFFAAAATTHADESDNAYRWQEVSGSAVHYFDTVPGRSVVTHSVTPTDTGVMLRSTETIDIFGDLNGQWCGRRQNRKNAKRRARTA